MRDRLWELQIIGHGAFGRDEAGVVGVNQLMMHFYGWPRTLVFILKAVGNLRCILR